MRINKKEPSYGLFDVREEVFILSKNSTLHVAKDNKNDEFYIGELRSSGYFKQDGNHVGRYILIEKAISVIETFRNVEKK